MKLMHLSDLHLGKHLMEYSLIADQEHAIGQILEMADTEKPDAVLIAGDVYDRSIPPEEAVDLFDRLLSGFAQRKLPVMLISGNHDSAQRVAFGHSLLKAANIHISPEFDGSISTVTLEDAYGPVVFWLMPYIHPADVRSRYGEDVSTSEEAVKAVMSRLHPDLTVRNVILSHQFIVGGKPGDSERQATVGTIDSVSASLYDGFDYVALGHLHNPQNVGRKDGTMRYCGTMVKYSMSESGDRSVTFVTLREKGSVTVETRPLTPLHDMRRLEGSFADLMRKGPEAGHEEDYYEFLLTDKTPVLNAAAQLRTVYPNFLGLTYKDRIIIEITSQDSVDRSKELKTTMELFSDLYGRSHEDPMDADTQALLQSIIDEAEKEEQV